ncbi:hypothetical protein ACFY6U_24165 [Streptomyces sp. NPDC013157]
MRGGVCRDVHEDLSGDVHGIAASAEADRVTALRDAGPRRIR